MMQGLADVIHAMKSVTDQQNTYRCEVVSISDSRLPSCSLIPENPSSRWLLMGKCKACHLPSAVVPQMQKRITFKEPTNRITVLKTLCGLLSLQNSIL